MATDLLDYAHQVFPRHEVAAWRNDGATLTLQSHTLVVHVVGVMEAASVLALAEREVGDGLVGAVIVRAHDASVVPDQPEDRDGVFDLPNRRIVAGAALGAGGGVLLGLLVGFASGAGAAAIAVITGFTTIVGGVLGAMSAGGARHAGQRATTQPQAAGREIAIVAAFLDDEQAASALARRVADVEQQYDMRIVGTDGSWHAPTS